MTLRRLLLLAAAAGALLIIGIVVAALIAHFIQRSGASLTLAPAFSLCLLFPAVLAALILSALLYREQRRMAPFWTVLSLTFLRLLLIILLAVLLFQPALRWEYHTTNAGTLWIILDQSPSMQTADPQSSPAERLHWADGMGLVTRKDRPDELSAQIGVLADELDALTPDPTLGGGGDERAAIDAFANRVDAWTRKLDKFRALVNAAQSTLNGYSANSGANAAREIANACDLAQANASAMRSASHLRDASSILNAFDIGADLHHADVALQPAIAAADAALLRRLQGTPDWTAANSRLASTPRADTAFGFLSGTDAPAAAPLRGLTNQYHVRIASFSDKAQAYQTVNEGSLPDTLKSALVPSGQATDIAGGLQYVAEQISADEAASVILVTDGRNNLGADPTAPARNLVARGIHVYGLLIGSHELSPDAAVEPVDFPDWIYAGDTLKPRALIRLDGLQGQTARIELRRGGQLLDTRAIRAAKPHDMVPFDFTDTPPASEKVLEYEIRVAPMPGEVNTQNNVATFRVAVKKDKIYALIIDDRPRWEFRYLAAYLARRPGMKLQTVLLQPAIIAGVAAPAPVLASPDNPRTEAQILPVTLDQWQKFDLIILGDVGPDVLTPQMQQGIAATVRDKGATLITIAGQQFMPERYSGSTLADLLPITLNPQYTPEQLARHARSGFLPESAPTAGMSVLAQLGADAASNARAWQNMPPWYWHSPFTQAKPAASVIWSIGEIEPARAGGLGGAAGGAAPEAAGGAGLMAQANRHALLSSLSIGLGRSLLLSSDQTWRLRQVGGANLHDRFWGQVLNWAVGSDLPAGGKYVRFGANQPTYEQTQPVIVTARILKDDLTPYAGLSFSAVARPVRSTNNAPANTVEARFEPMESPGYYQATLSGLPIGDDEISLKGAEVERLLNTDPTVTLRTILIKVFPTMNAERRNMNTDPETLEKIARAGGGFSVDGQYADVLLSRLPKIEHTEVSILQLGFFTDPAAIGTQIAHWSFLLLFALIITLEWGLRKRAGLI
jgi:hypothetical protein